MKCIKYSLFFLKSPKFSIVSFFIFINTFSRLESFHECQRGDEYVTSMNTHHGLGVRASFYSGKVPDPVYLYVTC